MSFKEFDLSDYIAALEDFKNKSADDVIKYWGNIDNFDLFIQKIKDDEAEVAKIAIAQFGSVENFTESMRYNLEHFSEVKEKQLSQIPEELKQKDLFKELASNKDKDVSCDEVQSIVKEIIDFAYGNAPSETLGNQENYCKTIIDVYSGDYCKAIFDTKNGAGSADYVVEAFQYAKDK